MTKSSETVRSRPECSETLARAGFTPEASLGAEFEAAVLVHLDAAYRFARYLARRSDVAEDLVQEALLRAFRGFDGRRGDNTRSWLLAIVRNCFLTWNARERQRPKEEALEDLERHTVALEAGGGGGETPEAMLIRSQEQTAMRRVIEDIPHPFREVLVLRDIEDLSYREIADIAGIPIGTVMSRLSRARKMFAVAWQAFDADTSREMLP